MYQFSPSILRAYDIRGVVGKTLGEADARAVGQSVGTMIRRAGGRTVATGRDGRASSKGLQAALNKGLMAAGLTVLDTGLIHTPGLYFAVHHLDAGGGVMVTGSHNPPEFNGFKMMVGRATLHGEAIQVLGHMAAEGDWEEGTGTREEHSVLDAYIDRLCEELPGRAFNIAWDAGNGAAGPAVRALAARMPGRQKTLYTDVDGRFPNHHPDPTVESNLDDLKQAVTHYGMDAGFAFDGDGDRVGVVDENGRVVWADQMMALMAAPVLARLPGAPIIADVKSSQILFDEIARLGGKPVMRAAGHSLIKAAMEEMNAPMAGEMSAHIFFSDRFYGFDDGLYAALRLLNALEEARLSLAEAVDHLPKACNTPEIRFDCSDERKFDVVAEVAGRLALAGAEVNTRDGVRIRRGNGWWLLRASNTQPALVVRIEAADEAGLERLRGEVRDALAESGVEAPADL